MGQRTRERKLRTKKRNLIPSIVDVATGGEKGEPFRAFTSVPRRDGSGLFFNFNRVHPFRWLYRRNISLDVYPFKLQFKKLINRLDIYDFLSL